MVYDFSVILMAVRRGMNFVADGEKRENTT